MFSSSIVSARPLGSRAPRGCLLCMCAAAMLLGCSSGTGLLRDYAKALESQRQGRNGEAESLYREILAARPGLEGVHNNLGVIARSRGALPVALDELRAERAQHPQLTSAQLNEALLVLESQGRAALRPLAEVLVAHAAPPALADPMAYLLLGIAHRGEGGDLLRSEAALDEAVLHGAGAVKVTAQVERAYARAELGKLAEAASDFADVAAQRPDSVASYNEALLRLQLGDDDSAQRAADRALALDPDAAPVQLLAASLDARVGDHRAALERCDRVLAAGDKNTPAQTTQALWRRGLSHLQLGDTKQALVDLSAARTAAPNEAALSFDVGLAHLAAGQLEPARDAFRSAASALPVARTNADTLDAILGATP